MTEVHYLSMIIIGVGSFIFGIIPMGVSIRTAKSYPLVLSLVLCLGAGVLLATSLIHMLTEVQTKLKLSAQLYFCSGFLILYAFDEIVHYCLQNKKKEVFSLVTDQEIATGTVCAENSYGALSENSVLLNEKNHTKKFTADNQIPKFSNLGYRDRPQLRHNDEIQIRENQQNLLETSDASSYQSQRQCHVEIGKPCSSNPVAKTGLLIALLIHSILEGISIGVQTEVSQILIILGAITFHKIVLSFCLALELISFGYKKLSLLAALLLFSIGSPIGILIGMSVTTPFSGIFNIDSQLQAVAAGSLLYVAAFEVLPRERFKWQHKNIHRAAGIFQLLFVLLGFICITILHLFVSGMEHGDGNTIQQNGINKTGF